MKRNEAVLNDLPGEPYTIEASDKVPHNCKYPLALIQAAQNFCFGKSRRFSKLLQLKIGAKVTLTVNEHTNDRLINSQTGSIRHTDFAQGCVHKVYVKFFDKQAGLKSIRLSYSGRQNS